MTESDAVEHLKKMARHFLNYDQAQVGLSLLDAAYKLGGRTAEIQVLRCDALFRLNRISEAASVAKELKRTAPIKWRPRISLLHAVISQTMRTPEEARSLLKLVTAEALNNEVAAQQKDD